MDKPEPLVSYRFELTEDGSAVVLSLETGSGTHRCTLPAGGVATEFIGELIEQLQEAGDPLSTPPEGPLDGFYPVYPVGIGIATAEDPMGEQHPLLDLDFGGCRIDCAVNPQVLIDQLNDLARYQEEAIAKTSPH